MSVAYLVCFAVEEEAKRCRSLFDGRGDVQIVLTGMGMRQAEASVGAALAHHSPRVVFSCGFAGAIRTGLNVGTVIFDKATTDASWQPLLESLHACPVQIATVDRVLTTTQEKAALYAASRCDAAEMESKAIREVCQARGIECVTLRVISDGACDDLPLDFNLLMRPDGRLDRAGLAFAVLRAPWKIPALMRLGRDSALAARELARVLNGVLSARR